MTTKTANIIAAEQRERRDAIEVDGGGWILETREGYLLGFDKEGWSSPFLGRYSEAVEAARYHIPNGVTA